MELEAPTPSIPLPGLTADARSALLGHFPPDVRTAYLRFGVTADPADADTVIRAIVADHIPEKARREGLPLLDEVALAADLGFDSIATTEMVFFIEDLFKVSISNAEIIRVRTVGDLRAYVRTKLAPQPPHRASPPA
jgi:acyl carrier protein